MTKMTIFKCPDCGDYSAIKSKNLPSEFEAMCVECGVSMELYRRRDTMKVVMSSYTDDPEMEIAKSGGVSHDAPVEGIDDARKRIRGFVEDGHWSTLEFADANFFVKGVSRSCLAQITRHRHASFMVQSMRYVEQEEADVVVPPSIEGSEYEDEFIKDAYESFAKYKKLVTMGVPKEDARFLLPLAWPTEFYIKANFREWRHIIDLRGLNKHAQHEIRELTQRILINLYKTAPSVFEDQYEELGEM